MDTLRKKGAVNRSAHIFAKPLLEPGVRKQWVIRHGGIMANWAFAFNPSSGLRPG